MKNRTGRDQKKLTGADRRAAGFTLLETLLVVAIIVVMAGVSIVGLVSIQKKLAQTALDSKAEIIYMAAQNRMTELKASGRASFYAPEADDVELLGIVPGDFDGDAEAAENLCYVDSATRQEGTYSTAAALLPASRVETELWDNHWIIEYDYKSGSVYSVFYSEEPMGYTPESFDSLRYRKVRLREGADVGYYGMGAVNSADTEVLQPQVTILNEEKLQAVLRCNTPDGEQLTFEVTVADSSGHMVKETLRTQLVRVGKYYEYVLTMDDLSTQNTRFAQRYPDLVPGEDLTVTLKAVSDSTLIDEQRVSASTNSLFAERQGTDTAVITYCRHLQNLDRVSGVGSFIQKAVQKSNLRFSNEEENIDDWYSCYGEKAFTPIVNQNLKSYRGSDDSEGSRVSTVIYGLSVEKDGNTGLFGTFFGGALQDITLSGTKILGGRNAGALAGEVRGNTTISGCSVFLNRLEGDLKGKTEKDVWIYGDAAGGLVGRTIGTSAVHIRNSSAATVVGRSADSAAGGLIGAAGGTVRLETSYADCYLYGQNTGGLAGQADGILEIGSCYTAGYQTAAVQAAGFVNGPVHAANSYAAVSYPGENTGKIYTTGVSGTADNVYYMKAGIAGTDLAGTQGEGFDFMSDRAMFAGKLGSAFTDSTGGANTAAYNLMNQGLTDYSFPRLDSLVHYGDWQAEFVDKSLVYYEKYEDGSFGFFGANTDALSPDKVVVGDGYGIICESIPYGEVQVDYPGGTLSMDPGEAQEVSAGGISYWIAPLPKNVVNTDIASKDFYQQIKLDGESYYYNPHFAKTVTADTQMPENPPDTISVRSPRQLHSMSLYYGAYAEKTANSTFLQETEVDYIKYDWKNYFIREDVRVQKPIGMDEKMPFRARYDGNYHRIIGVSFETENNYVGMFGYNAGTLRNVALASEFRESGSNYVKRAGTIQGRGTQVYMGVLAGYNAGTVTNCAVSGYIATGDKATIYSYSNSSVALGGLTGCNTGSVRDSSAVCPAITATANYSTLRMGGFAGINRGDIYRCYSLGTIEIKEAKRGSVDIAGFIGENRGIARNAYCATSLVASGSAVSYGFAPVGGTVSNCYLLNGGTYLFVDALHAYNSTGGDARAVEKTDEELRALTISGFGRAAVSEMHQRTPEDSYPYPAVVRNEGGEYIHYGDWTTVAGLGEIGFFYWEKEIGGSNAGYYMDYVGLTEGTQRYDFSGISGKSLCVAHNDGGRVEEYGYGYYVKDGIKQNQVDFRQENSFGTPGSVNAVASSRLQEQFTGYTFFAYNTGTTGSSHLYLTEGNALGTCWIEMKNGRNEAKHKFTLSPFFASAFCYEGAYDFKNKMIYQPGAGDAAEFGGKLANPGSADNPFEIRSDEQLQYINWNGYNRNATTSITGAWNPENRYFPYLIYVSGNSAYTGDWNYYWEQTHDVDADMTPSQTGTGGREFTSIGSMYDAIGGNSNNSQMYIAYFGGVYNGGDYTIRNLEIHSDTQAAGLFGFTAGAKLENIVLYSERGNYIEMSDKSSNWYCIGGLAGYAAQGKNPQASITNCTVSGYNLLINRDEVGGWGGAYIGGFVGASNMQIKNCTAVNDIDVAFTYDRSYENARVGGLIGGCRGTIEDCYVGGTIVSRVPNRYSGVASSVSVWVGGIVGGIVMKDSGNLKQLVGSVTGNPVVKNSYSYVKLPKAGGNQIRNVQSIASIGEMLNGAFGVIENPNIWIENCYCLKENAENRDDQYTKDGVLFSQNGRTIFINNDGHSPYLTYGQMSARSGEADALIDLLRSKGGGFGFVTTRENGAAIDGKYSYPGEDRALDGKNYPFPTTLTQTDVFGNRVNVHYGSWPKGSFYWTETTAELDLLGDRQEGEAVIRLQLQYDGYLWGDPVFTFRDEQGQVVNHIAEIQSCSYDWSKGCYFVSVKGLSEGLVSLTAEYQGESAEMVLDVTAVLNVICTPNHLILSPEGSGTVTVQAVSENSRGETVDYSGLVTWTAVTEDDNIAEPGTILPGGGGYGLQIRGISTGSSTADTGETRITVTASCDLEGVTYTGVSPIVVTVNRE